MNRIGYLLGLFIFVMFLLYMLPLIFKFLDINTSSYAIYMMWLIALLIFYLLLPSKVSLFN